MKLRVFWTLCYVVFKVEAVENQQRYFLTPEMSAHPPVFTRKVNVVAFDGKWKLVMHVDLPFEGKKILPKDYEFFFSGNGTVSRPTRAIDPVTGATILGIGAGASLVGRWLWDLYWNDVEYREKLTAAINEDREAIAVIEKELTNVTSHIVDMDRDVEGSVEHIFNTTNVNWANSREILSDALQFIRLSWFDDSIRSCTARTLPSKLIAPGVLRQELLEQLPMLVSKNLALAIDLENLSAYYSFPLTKCYVTPGKFTVLSDVPVRKVQNNWEIFHVSHAKFAFNSQVCTISNNGETFIAKSQGKTITLGSGEQQDCKITDGLCMVPEFEATGVERLRCLSGILDSDSFESLSKKCSFNCFETTELFIHQVNTTTISITNAELILEECNGMSLAFKLDKLGAVLVNRKCGCTYNVDGKIIIDEPLICIESGTKASVFHVIPELWTDLTTDSAEIENTGKGTRKMNFNWPNELKVFNVTTPSKLTPANFNGSLSWSNPVSWLLHGHSVVLIVLIALFIHVYCRAYRM